MSELSFRKFASIAAFSTLLAGVGRRGGVLLALGFILGLFATLGVVLERGILAAAFLAFSRLTFAVVPQDRRGIREIRHGLASISLAGTAFGFALADQSHALAASLLVLGILAASVVRLPENTRAWDKWFDGAFSAGLFFACVAPAWFGIIAYSAAIGGFLVAGVAVAALAADRTK